MNDEFRITNDELPGLTLVFPHSTFDIRTSNFELTYDLRLTTYDY